LLDKAATLNRNAQIQERLTGLLQEVRCNRNLLGKLVTDLQAFVEDPAKSPFPSQRCRNTAPSNYLNAPFPVPDLPINLVDQYWEIIRMFSEAADSLDGAISVEGFRKQRLTGVVKLAPDLDSHGALIEKAVVSLLTQLNGTKSL
jgi:hypothetical protein